MILPRAGEDGRAQALARARSRWGTVLRFALKMRAVPHPVSDDRCSVRVAPPPLGRGEKSLGCAGVWLAVVSTLSWCDGRMAFAHATHHEG